MRPNAFTRQTEIRRNIFRDKNLSVALVIVNTISEVNTVEFFFFNAMFQEKEMR